MDKLEDDGDNLDEEEEEEEEDKKADHLSPTTGLQDCPPGVEDKGDNVYSQAYYPPGVHQPRYDNLIQYSI